MSKLKLQATDGSAGTVSLKAPASTTGNAEFEFTLPGDAGSNGKLLSTNGSGVLSWSADLTYDSTRGLRVSTASGPHLRINPDASDASANARTYLGQATGANQFLSGSADDDTVLSGPSNLLFGTGNSGTPTEKMRISGVGDISIGGCAVNTFTNYQTLTIGGARAVDGVGIDLERSDGNIYGRFFADANGVQIQSTQSGDYIRFETGGANERLRITSDGIDVSGDIELDNGGSAGINFKRSGTLKADIEIGSGSDQIAMRARGSSGFISFHTNTSSDERLRIESDGKVYINRTTALDSNYVNFSATKALSAGIPQNQVNIGDAAAYNTTDNGGAIGFSAIYSSGGAYTTMASIEGVKTNNTDGNYNGDMVFKTRSHNGNNVTRMRLIDAGLCFGSDTAAANALDDYEYGTFTPTAPNSSATITNTNSCYTKIGRLVMATYHINFSSTNSDPAQVSLPITAGGKHNSAVGGMVTEHNVGSTSIAAGVDSTTVVRFLQRGQGGTAYTADNLNGKTLRFSVWYMTE